MSRRLALAALAFACAGCAALATEVVVPAQRLPEAFDGRAAGESAARTSWRTWLADAHLEALVDEAMRNNLDLLVALQRVEAARATVRAATGALLPEVALSLGSGIRRFGLFTMDGAGNASTEITPGRIVPENLPDFAVGLQASWEVDLWGRLRSQRHAAIARYLATVEGTNLVLSALVADVASAYFDLLALDYVRETLRRSAEQQGRALDVVRLQKEAGRANDLAVRQFEAQLADTRALERASVQQATVAENQINLLLGRYPQPVSRDRAVLLADAPGVPSSGVPSDLLVNRPDVREAELGVRATKFDLKAARAAFFPRFTIAAGGGYQAFEPGLLFRTPESLAYSVAGALVAPLVNRRALEAQFAGAKADQIQAMYEYQRTLLVAVAEVTNALSNVQVMEQVLAARRDQHAALERSVATAGALYRAGKATYLEVLLAQQSSLQADVALVEAARARRVANVAVYKALGGGWR